MACGIFLVSMVILAGQASEQKCAHAKCSLRMNADCPLFVGVYDNMNARRLWFMAMVFSLITVMVPSATIVLAQDDADATEDNGSGDPVEADSLEVEAADADTSNDDGRTDTAPENSEDAEAVPPNALKRFESFVDEKAGVVVGKIASVLFYEFVGRKEHSSQLDKSPTDGTNFSALVATVADRHKPDEVAGESWSAAFVRSKLTAAEAAQFDEAIAAVVSRIKPQIEQVGGDINPNEADFSLTVPGDSVTGEGLSVLSDVLTNEFTVSRLKNFSVQEGDQTIFSATKSGIPIIVAWLVAGATFSRSAWGSSIFVDSHML